MLILWNWLFLVGLSFLERTARQELEKLARMEAAMAEHERKVIEEQEKQEKLQQMHKVCGYHVTCFQSPKL